MFTEKDKPAVPKYSTYEIRVLESILEFLEKYHTTPSLTQLAELVYGDPEKKSAVHYHVAALREAGAISDNPALKGRIALEDVDRIKQEIERDRAIYAAKAEMEMERDKG